MLSTNDTRTREERARDEMSPEDYSELLAEALRLILEGDSK
jgi:hypothetical protein